jgi:hypothetical protein
MAKARTILPARTNIPINHLTQDGILGDIVPPIVKRPKTPIDTKTIPTRKGSQRPG